MSLFIAIYNQVDLLKFQWASLENQSFKNFEVILCDDGSRPEIVQQIHELIKTSSIPCLHLWQPDKGFRKNRMLNWALHFTRSPLVTVIDQDCVLHPEFLKEHFLNTKEDQVLCGRRMDLTPFVSRLLTPEKIKSGYIEKNLWWMILLGLPMKDNNGKKGIYITDPKQRERINRRYRGIVGCNFSVLKKHLMNINGFDTRYEGAGTGEDSDIEYRMSLQGVTMKSFANAAVQYHIYHKLQNRPNINEKIFAEVRAKKQDITTHGLKEQLLQSHIEII